MKTTKIEIPKTIIEAIAYLFLVCIPGNRKPGKYLQKVTGRRSGIQIKDLSESIIYDVVVVRDYGECVKALSACNSCQSRNNARMITYWKVWGSHPDCFVITLNDEAGIPLARGVINPKKGTYTNMYGPKHFLLEARCRFAGFEYGEVATEEEIATILMTKKKAKKSFPKSRSYWKTGITYQESYDELKKEYDSVNNRYHKLLNKNREDFQGTHSEYLGKKIPGNLNDFLNKNWGLYSLRKNINSRMEQIQLEVKSKTRKGESESKVWKEVHIKTTPTLVHVPIKEDWEYIKGREGIEVSNLYLDSESRFVEYKVIQEEGWVQK